MIGASAHRVDCTGTVHVTHCAAFESLHQAPAPKQATASRWPAPAAAPTHPRGQLPYTCIIYHIHLLCALRELNVSRQGLHNLVCPLHVLTCHTFMATSTSVTASAHPSLPAAASPPPLPRRACEHTSGCNHGLARTASHSLAMATSQAWRQGMLCSTPHIKLVHLHTTRSRTSCNIPNPQAAGTASLRSTTCT